VEQIQPILIEQFVNRDLVDGLGDLLYLRMKLLLPTTAAPLSPFGSSLNHHGLISLTTKTGETHRSMKEVWGHATTNAFIL
jgi:hypothetical protein